MENLNVSFVVIGLNAEKFLKGCITSIYAQKKYSSNWEIIYVDSSSSDKSVEIARSFRNVTIVHLDDEKPNAAKARNAGWRIAKHDLIQFLDADSYLKPDWISTALAEISEGKILTGGLVEREPDKNYYHEMANLDWQQSLGNISGNKIKKVKSFGGNVLIPKKILKEVNGFNEELFAGEDSDLSYRIRENGQPIFFIPKIMASHDIQTGCLKSYAKRVFRTGMVYTSLALKYAGRKEKLYLREMARLYINSLLLLSGLFTLMFTDQFILGLLVTAIPFRIFFRNTKKNQPLTVSVKYNFHLMLSFLIQFAGSLRFLFDSLHLTDSFSYYKNTKQVH